MLSKFLLLFGSFFPLLLTTVQAETIANRESVITLNWVDLIPESERSINTQKIDHSIESPQQSSIGGVRSEFSGDTVKIPGFVIPLEGDKNKVTEFLLVPYFGACIHVPPPPPNQIIYVKYPKGAPIEELWSTIYLVGVLKTESMSHDLAKTSYLMEGIAIEEYKDTEPSE